MKGDLTADVVGSACVGAVAALCLFAAYGWSRTDALEQRVEALELQVTEMHVKAAMPAPVLDIPERVRGVVR